MRRFFGVSTRSKQFGRLIDCHDLSHKQTADTGTIAFDAMTCSGAGDYAKCTIQPSGEIDVREAAMRGFGKSSKAELQGWLRDTFSTDTLQELAPVTHDQVLLKAKDAAGKVGVALRSVAEGMYFPLGLPIRKVRAYKVIKASSFVFRDPDQRLRLTRQIDRFVVRTGCGLDLVALRRGYGRRREGSLNDLLAVIYDHIQEGGRDLTKLLNLHHESEEGDRIARQRRSELRELRETTRSEFLASVDLDQLPAEVSVHGIIIDGSRLLAVV